MGISRLSPAFIESKIKSVSYYVFPETTLTVACIILENGYTATGESACVDPLNFDQALGEKLAYAKAFDKIWMLEGYLAKQRLFESE